MPVPSTAARSTVLVLAASTTAGAWVASCAAPERPHDVAPSPVVTLESPVPTPSPSEASAEPAASAAVPPAQDDRESAIDRAIRDEEARFPVLPELERPAFLTPELLLRSVPPPRRTATTVELSRLYLTGDWIDPRTMVVRFQWGALAASVLLVSPRAGLLDVASFDERTQRVMLRDVAGTDTPEIIVPVTRGNSMSDLPGDWEIFEVTEAHRLHRIATIAKTAVTWESDGHGLHPGTCFFNRVEFPRKGHMVVEAVAAVGVAGCGSARVKQEVPARVGERHEYDYIPAQRRFVEVK